ncbi:MAG: endonuclease V [Bacteroidales bacterium]
MIAAVDVYYNKDSGAAAGVALFSSFSVCKPYSTYYVNGIQAVENYVPGQFYKRELPCIMTALGGINEAIDIVIIDGYVNPGNKPGLGHYLWTALGGNIAVIGVAKSFFQATDAVKVFRGKSHKPLYVTSAGIDPAVAAVFIENMHGKYRIPDMLRITDMLSRTGKYELAPQ